MLEPGDLIAEKYQVKALIGRGGMGEVYLVRHALTGRRFALKVLAPALVGTATASQRLVREALAAGRVEHRNVVDVFDVGEHRGAVYLVMEYLEGKPMSELLETGELSDRIILSLMLRAMEGVAAAHDHGIVHRDLKPENIFVCQGPRGGHDDPRVMDFGISRLPDQLGSSGDTNVTGFVVGTPHFMCLEQLEGARDLDARVDVYALGVSLYRALSGRVPFEGDNLGILSQRIAHDTPVSLAVLRPDLPQLLTQTVMKAMAKRREHRHSNVRALVRDLEPFAAGLSELPHRERRLRNSTGSIPALTASQLSQVPGGFATGGLRGAPTPPAATVPPVQRFAVSPWLYVAASVPLAALSVWWLSRPPEPVPEPVPVVAAAPRVSAPAAAIAPSAPAPQAEAPRPAAVTPAMIIEARPSTVQRPAWRPPKRPARPAPAAKAARMAPGRPQPARNPALPARAPAPVASTAAPAAPAAARPAASPTPGDDLLEEAPRPRLRSGLDETDPYR